MSLKATATRSIPAKDPSRRAGLRGLRSNRARSAAKGNGLRPPPSPMKPHGVVAIDEAPLTRHERRMAQLVGLGLWGGMAAYLFIQRDPLFAAAQAAARAIGLH